MKSILTIFFLTIQILPQAQTTQHNYIHWKSKLWGPITLNNDTSNKSYTFFTKDLPNKKATLYGSYLSLNPNGTFVNGTISECGNDKSRTVYGTYAFLGKSILQLQKDSVVTTNDKGIKRMANHVEKRSPNSYIDFELSFAGDSVVLTRKKDHTKMFYLEGLYTEYNLLHLVVRMCTYKEDIAGIYDGSFEKSKTLDTILILPQKVFLDSEDWIGDEESSASSYYGKIQDRTLTAIEPKELEVRLREYLDVAKLNKNEYTHGGLFQLIIEQERNIQYLFKFFPAD